MARYCQLSNLMAPMIPRMHRRQEQRRPEGLRIQIVDAADREYSGSLPYLLLSRLDAEFTESRQLTPFDLRRRDVGSIASIRSHVNSRHAACIQQTSSIDFWHYLDCDSAKVPDRFVDATDAQDRDGSSATIS